MEYRIKMRYHWWFDNGLVSLYYIARNLKQDYNVKVITEEDGLLFQYSAEEELVTFLRACYEDMAKRYYNVSSKKQRESCECVAYNEEKDEIYALPRVRPIEPIGSLISGPSYKGKGLRYQEIDVGLKKRIDQFMKEQKKSLFSSKKIVLSERVKCHDDKLLIKPAIKKNNKICSICGGKTDKLVDMSLLIYILTASKSASLSFHSNGKEKSNKVCWECSYVGRFVYDSFHIKMLRKNKQVMLIAFHTSNFNQLIDAHEKMGRESTLREVYAGYFKANIKGNLINKAKTNNELLWSVFVDKYKSLRDESVSNEEVKLFEEEIRGYILQPIQIIMLYLSEKGKTFLARDLVMYNDSSYMFQLIHKLHEQKIDLEGVFNDLYESYRDNSENLHRTRILGKCLHKQSILLQVEQISFTKVMKGGTINIQNMLAFVTQYELSIREDVMNKEQIEIAVKLGKQIVLQAIESHKSSEQSGTLKKIKGDLFTLRKTRTVTDFLKQINTLQFRYNISINSVIGEGILNDVPFEEFKAYCIMGALNIYNMKQKKGGKEND